jgi:hypothetical protein
VPRASGSRELPESTRDDLSGYAGARPVRVGNAAFSQRQNDVFGAVLDSILLHTRRNERLPGRLWPIVESQAECATRVWRDPDQGIWEARGKPQHYVSSKLMCWVALDRASALAEIRGDPSVAATWRATADEIRADVLAHGVSDRGVLRQHYETDALDASTLLAGSFKFLAHDDKRLQSTVLAVAQRRRWRTRIRPSRNTTAGTLPSHTQGPRSRSFSSLIVISHRWRFVQRKRHYRLLVRGHNPTAGDGGPGHRQVRHVGNVGACAEVIAQRGKDDCLNVGCGNAADRSERESPPLRRSMLALLAFVSFSPTLDPFGEGTEMRCVLHARVSYVFNGTLARESRSNDRSPAPLLSS